MTHTHTTLLAHAGNRVKWAHGWALGRAFSLVPGLVLGLVLLLSAGAVSAQPAEQVFGPYTLRASTVSLDALPQAMRDQYALPGGENQAILNVTVQFRGVDGATDNLRAQVRAMSSNMTGVPIEIPLRAVQMNGMVSYLGVYPFAASEVLDFRIEATPEGQTRPLVLEFRDRLGRR